MRSARCSTASTASAVEPAALPARGRPVRPTSPPAWPRARSTASPCRRGMLGQHHGSFVGRQRDHRHAAATAALRRLRRDQRHAGGRLRSTVASATPRPTTAWCSRSPKSSPAASRPAVTALSSTAGTSTSPQAWARPWSPMPTAAVRPMATRSTSSTRSMAAPAGRPCSTWLRPAPATCSRSRFRARRVVRSWCAWSTAIVRRARAT